MKIPYVIEIDLTKIAKLDEVWRLADVETVFVVFKSGEIGVFAAVGAPMGIEIKPQAGFEGEKRPLQA